MKIVEGSEPLFCDAGDSAFHVMTDIASAGSDEDLNERLDKWMPLPFDTMVNIAQLSVSVDVHHVGNVVAFLQIQLADWKGVLNKLDDRMGRIVQKWKVRLILSAKEVEDVTPGRGDFETDVTDLKRVLKFTAQLLRWTINKEVYNSTEVRRSGITQCGRGLV
jgi:hypothetical protein